MDFELTPEQQDSLADFIVANDLLKECLELAYMSPADKKRAQEGLYGTSAA